MKLRRNQKGFTLIELIVVIAILGILAMMIVPRLSGFKAQANEQVNETNAKLLSNVAQMIAASDPNGAYPAWIANPTTITVAQANNLISEDVAYRPNGSLTSFTYEPSTGKVLAGTEAGGTTNPTAPSLSSVALTVNNATANNPTITIPTVSISGFTFTGWSATHEGNSNIVIVGSTATFYRESGYGSVDRTGTITLTGTWSGGTLTKTFHYSIPRQSSMGNGEVEQTSVTYTP